MLRGGGEGDLHLPQPDLQHSDQVHRGGGAGDDLHLVMVAGRETSDLTDLQEVQLHRVEGGAEMRIVASTTSMLEEPTRENEEPLWIPAHTFKS